MDCFRRLNEWLMQEFHTISRKQPCVPQKAHSRIVKVATPHNIPDFVIPGVDDDGSIISKKWKICHVSSPVVTSTDSPAEMEICMYSRGGMPVSSVLATSQYKLDDISSYTDDWDEQGRFTNDDPLSIAAMSLHHLRTQTSYGFTTLSESPKTLRKESLFHSYEDSVQKRFGKRKQHKSSSKSNDDTGGYSFTTQRDQLESSVIPKSSNQRAIEMTDAYMVFAKDSTTVSNDLLQFPIKSNPFRRHRVYNRQRSSLGEQVYVADSAMEKNFEENSSLTHRSVPASHNHHWQSSGELHAPPIQGQMFNSHSAPNVSTSVSKPNPLENQDKIMSSSCFSIRETPQVDNTYAPHGELKFSFQYLAASKQLKVCLIRAENLGNENITDFSMNSFATLYLMPAKLQKQSGIVVKCTKNPNFNQTFYFQQLTLEELHNMVLRIKLFNKCHNLKLAEFIGEVSIPLDGYDLLQESRMWKDLKTKEEREDSGLLEFALQFQPREGLLKVTIFQAKSLPYHHMTGAPYPYVKVDISQPNRPLLTKQTKTKKNTCGPVFAETFSFTVSPKMDDLRYTTVTISVFAYKRLLRDNIIGQIIIGSTSTEESLLHYWDEVITNPDTTFTKWHYLTEVE
ncbi:hypothetical protein ACJMK2_003644 [Sinanodonta woodiana]|uniref:C2 domain-containing protein n=1 Tax=Sinanodonta woodiana TaxID=1069815 RepID=A0ABD3Y200_SINWO